MAEKKRVNKPVFRLWLADAGMTTEEFLKIPQEKQSALIESWKKGETVGTALKKHMKGERGFSEKGGRYTKATGQIAEGGEEDFLLSQGGKSYQERVKKDKGVKNPRTGTFTSLQQAEDETPAMGDDLYASRASNFLKSLRPALRSKVDLDPGDVGSAAMTSSHLGGRSLRMWAQRLKEGGLLPKGFVATDDITGEVLQVTSEVFLFMEENGISDPEEGLARYLATGAGTQDKPIFEQAPFQPIPEETLEESLNKAAEEAFGMRLTPQQMAHFKNAFRGAEHANYGQNEGARRKAWEQVAIQGQTNAEYQQTDIADPDTMFEEEMRNNPKGQAFRAAQFGTAMIDALRQM